MPPPGGVAGVTALWGVSGERIGGELAGRGRGGMGTGGVREAYDAPAPPAPLPNTALPGRGALPLLRVAEGERGDPTPALAAPPGLALEAEAEAEAAAEVGAGARVSRDGEEGEGAGEVAPPSPVAAYRGDVGAPLPKDAAEG